MRMGSVAYFSWSGEIVTSNILTASREYTARGWVVHPLSKPIDTRKSPGKRPLLQDWQKLTKTPDTIENFIKNGDNIGLVCGKASGITIIDLDHELFTDELFNGFELDTLRSARTKGRGHIYFKYNPNLPSSKHHDLGIEILSDGSNAVLPPSIHASGDVYGWINPNAPIIEIPKALENNLKNLFKTETELKQIIGKCRYCFKNVLKDKKDMHGAEGREYMLVVCTDLKANGATEEHAKMFAKLMYREGYDETRTLQEWAQIDAGKTWQCNTLKAKLPAFIDLNECGKCDMRRERNEGNGKVRQESEEKSCGDCRYCPGETGRCNKAKKLVMADDDATNCEHFKQAKQKKEACDDSQDDIIKHIESNGIELFHDDTQNPYARVPLNGNLVILKVRDRDFKRWLSRMHYRETGKALGSEAINSALNIIEAIACFDCREYKLHNRLCWHDGAIWYDLGNWEAIKITSQGWEIMKNPPILFRQYKHQQKHDDITQKQHDSANNSIKEILQFVNIKDDNEKLLFLIYVVSCFIPDIPHPIPVVHGEKGAAKSTLSKIVKKLVDPSAEKTASFPKHNTELVQKLAHHYFIGFDNVSRLSDWQSDALCRACTGEGFSKRELYSDDDDIIYTYQRCIALNGINVVARKADLLDRSILLKLERIPKGQRKTERELWQAFEKVKGEILGGIFTTVSQAMAIQPTIRLDELPRMADFALWGCAIAETLGYGKEAFLDAYYANIQIQNIQAIEGSPVGDLILKFMENQDEWEGSPSDLLIEFESLAVAMRVNIKAKGFPKSANTITRRLNEIKSNLIEQGVFFEIDRSAHQRTIKVRKISSLSSYRHDQERETGKNMTIPMTIQKNISSHISSFKKHEQATQHDDNDSNDGISRTFLSGSNGKLSQLDKMHHVYGLLYDGMTQAGIDLTASQAAADLSLSKDEALEYVKRAIADRDRRGG
jgi:hypothetical protein